MSPKKPTKSISYADAGVHISTADATKEEMAATLRTTDARVLNSVDSWAFASLFDGRFPGYKHPVLVLKTEEPGSKQLLAFKHDRVESICQDMINHLINDIAVMGAVPVSVQDAVICGKLEKKVVTRIVKAVADACTLHECVLTGGETSEQPGVLAPGTYILTSSVIGVVEKDEVVDGSKIKEGDVVLAVASNGLHTNGYSLVRALMKKDPKLAKKKTGGRTFLDAILLPHTAYFPALKGVFKHPGLTGMAHITGSGIEGNLERILPATLNADKFISGN
jgi:phosphoribosylformylglycinamidine cyclo-ligase